MAWSRTGCWCAAVHHRPDLCAATTARRHLLHLKMRSRIDKGCDLPTRHPAHHPFLNCSSERTNCDRMVKHESVPAFFDIVNATCQDEFNDQIVSALKRRMEAPPSRLLSSVLDQSLDDSEVRRMLYTPTSADMALYVPLLAGDPYNPSDLSDNAANKAQALTLTHLFLVHGRVWACLRPFIEAGGLRRLVDLLAHPNKLLASQALQLLLLATHPDMYDWNKPPGHGNTASDQQPSNSSSSSSSQVQTQQQQQHPALGPDGALWRQLASLHNTELLPVLLSLSPDAWPGSGVQAVQLMVFYLTWLRTWWSQDGNIQLSQAMLYGLRAWSIRAAASDTEQQLAAQLLEDFGKAGPAPAVKPGSSSSSFGSSGGSSAVEFDLPMELRVTADRTQVNTSAGNEAARFKAAGNDAFKAKDWATAIRLYSAALDVPVSTAALLDEAPRRAVYHTNRAAAYLERVWELQAAAAAADRDGSSSSSSSSSRSGCEVGGLLDGMQLDGSAESVDKQLGAAVMDCRAALDLVPSHIKAHYRLATALKAQGDLAAAAKAAAAAKEHAVMASDRAAAASLAAAIRRQQQDERSRPIVVTATKATAAGGLLLQQEKPGQLSADAAAGGCHQSKKVAAAAGSDPVSQLLQEFSAEMLAAAKPAPITLSVRRGTGGELQDDDDTDTLLVPCNTERCAGRQQQHSTYAAGPVKQNSGNGKVLVEVLASSDDLPTQDTYCTEEKMFRRNSSCNGSEVQDLQPGQSPGINMDELVELLD